ncbi:MAG: phosphatidylglycerophosphatase A family protein [Pseudomonadota bacterium]
MRLKLVPGALPAGISFWHPASLIATWFGTGFAPLGAGSWGSLAALPAAWIVDRALGAPGLAAAAGVAALAGWWAAEVVDVRARERDPGLIVIDEVAGMFLTLVFAPPTWWGYASAFVLFRIADILKPFPANWCEANVEGGLGVMLDDLVAALYAGAGTWFASEFILRQYVVPLLPF